MDANLPAAAVELVAGDFLLTVNPVDGCEIVSCPPGRRPLAPRRPRQDGPRTPAARRGDPHLASLAPPPLLEREEERERLSRLLARGRSVRLTGAPGAGRTALLNAAAEDCATLAPDGVIRLTGHRRTPDDLLHELYAAVHHTRLYRPGRPELTAALREIGAVVILDDIEFGGAGLDTLLDATPECAFLISAHPGVPAPAGGSRLEEVFLSGISRDAHRNLVELTAGRPLGHAEADWAAGLWLATEGAPLGAVQAGTLLRLRAEGPLPEAAGLAAGLALALPDGAREILRLAVALGGELPGPAHLAHLARLAASTGDPQATAARAELLRSGLVTATGSRHRLSAAAAADLAAAGYADAAPARALAAAQHFTGWLSERGAAAEPGAERAAAETEVLLAVVQAAQRGGHPHAVADLARAAAPLLAIALRWSAWERMLRSGAESARAVGDIARQAYFHHELGVLAICQGQLDRARAELEASTALRGVLADASGATAGRRALTLVEDLSRPPALPPSESTMRLALPPAAPAAPPPGPAAPAEQLEPVGPVVPAGSEDATQTLPRQQPVHHAAGTTTRRNLAAAAAGALLVAVLATVVGLGVTSDTDDAPANDDRADPTLTDPDTGPDLDPTTPGEGPTGPTDDPSSSGPSPTPEESATTSDPATGPTTPAGPTEPTAEPGSPSGQPTESGSGGVGPTPSDPDPTTSDPRPTPSESETDPEPTPTETETETEDPSPTPTETETATETETSSAGASTTAMTPPPPETPIA